MPLFYLAVGFYSSRLTSALLDAMTIPCKPRRPRSALRLSRLIILCHPPHVQIQLLESGAFS